VIEQKTQEGEEKVIKRKSS